ncbi:hypothetical protein PHYBLDRAFT_152296 [Phycomyces blakesleeanus NRRL 1555(-)]|uniref:Uncharacterized protein n=1 Tax=Phycomyces blakesleeanus (strain ATCC 8743b / DSM 1359 / FGSC 10004 / NBRC 33097 / NRRL 1555) TaxID=763407 RepID=A0A167JQA8_PHYB8|nr:hypothetical protein PHYBLDRAFT_152296 [Phycomyces blakesleeanus NRRL 1555(-)]OAD66489.1 hypothetical protein PHYBLDRAFT_152296 [Phycomyces blakesleeanus NRRL 1555(-)]|eukprot:XP_018284529.1 hypothetical protein PHYBLDRAFT_152296 [Phycomyces blakesleeanus NRRL 1555(-)]
MKGVAKKQMRTSRSVDNKALEQRAVSESATREEGSVSYVCQSADVIRLSFSRFFSMPACADTFEASQTNPK